MSGDSLICLDVDYVVGRPLLSGVSVEFAPGEIACLSGASGSGKTTLISVCGGLLPPTAGTAEYGGRPMWRGTGDPRPEVAFVLQVYGLVPILSAAENVAVALRARGQTATDADRRALEALEMFGIGDLADRQVEELSGGQLQRVALARGLAPRSRILFADEPTSELDQANRDLVLQQLRAVADDGGIVVVATHDPAVADRCDRVYQMDEGVLTPLTPSRAERNEGQLEPLVGTTTPPDPPGRPVETDESGDEGPSPWAR